MDFESPLIVVTVAPLIMFRASAVAERGTGVAPTKESLDDP